MPTQSSSRKEQKRYAWVVESVYILRMTMTKEGRVPAGPYIWCGLTEAIPVFGKTAVHGARDLKQLYGLLTVSDSKKDSCFKSRAPWTTVFPKTGIASFKPHHM